MADTKIIAASVQVDTDAATKNMLKLKGTVEDLRKEFKKTAAGSDEQLAALKKLTAAEQDLAKAQAQLNQANEKTTGHFSKIKAGISEIPGATGAAGKGVTELSSKFKALLANPIVLVIAAIVTVLVTLYKAFTSTADGADKMEQIFSGLGAVIDVLRDRVLKIAGAIAKFFTGDFKGAIQDAKGAVSGLGDEIAAEFQKAADATKKLQEVEDAMRDLGVSRAKLNRDLAKTKEILTDENATFAEKKKAIEEVRIAEGKQTEQELANARKKLEAIKAKNALSDVSDEKAQEEADAQAAVYALEEKSASDIRSLNKQSRAIEKQEAAKAKEERLKAAEEEKKRRQELVEFTNKLTKLQQDNELALIKDGYQKELKQLENRIADEKRQNELSFKDKKINKEQLSQLNVALDIQANIQRDAINDKHNEDVKKKEEAFQKELGEIGNKIKLANITDSREKERVQLDISYNEQLAQSIERYKNDQAKFQEGKTKIDELYRVQKQSMEDKFAEEDAKKKFEKELKAQESILTDPKSSFDAKKAALDEEVRINQEAFDKKTITEEQYLENKKKFQKASEDIGKAEVQAAFDNAGKIGGLLENLSGLVGKQTALGKAFSAANATIQAIQSANSSYAAMAAIPVVGPALGAVAAAAALVAGYANVKKILAVKVPGQADGAAPSVSGATTPAAPLAPTQTSTSLDQGTINNIGNAAAGGVNGIRAYVVEQDSAAAAARAARLQGAAVLGG